MVGFIKLLKRMRFMVQRSVLPCAAVALVFAASGVAGSPDVVCRGEQRQDVKPLTRQI